MKSKWFVMVSVLIVASIALSACGGAAAGGGEETAAGPLQEVGEGEGALSIVAWAGYVERGEQRRRAVTYVVVGDAFDIAEAHRQHGLGALERLALTLLVDAQHQRMIGRVEVQPDDVADLLDEERIVRQLEALRAVRLQSEQRQVAVYGALRQPGFVRQAATRPVCLAARFSRQRGIDQRGDLILAGAARSAGLELVVQPVEQPADAAGAEGAWLELYAASSGWQSGTTDADGGFAFPSPVMFGAVKAKTQGDEDKIGVALNRLVEEDPTLRVERNAEGSGGAEPPTIEGAGPVYEGGSALACQVAPAGLAGSPAGAGRR